MITSEAFDLLLAAAAKQHTVAGNFDGPLRGAQMALYTNTPTIEKTTPLASFDQPTFAGYALAALTWGAPFRDPAGKIALLSNMVIWQMSDALIPTTITGVLVLNSGGTAWLLAEQLAAPYPLVDETSLLALVAKWFGTNDNPGVFEMVD